VNRRPISSTALIIPALIVGTVYLFLGGLDLHAARSLKHLWDLGHIGYFALLAWSLLRLRVISALPLFHQWAGLLLLSLLLGALIELLQGGIDRTSDVADIVRDISGALLALAFHPSLAQRGGHQVARWMRVAVAVVLLLNMVPLGRALIDEAIARAQFPLLSNFSTALELDRWDGDARQEIVRVDARSDARQMKIDLTTARYSGVGLEYFPGDWRGFRVLKLRLFQPQQKRLRITLRIHDVAHEAEGGFRNNDRFNRRFSLEPGWHDIAIPLSDVENSPQRRKMDMSRIIDVSLFVSALKQPRVLYLDEIALAR
jgi:hypothetical protein